VFAVDPDMCARAEARALGLDPDTVVVSLGTGSLVRRIAYDEAKDWGLIEWAQPVLDVVFDGSSDVVDYQLGEVLGRDRLFRFQTRSKARPTTSTTQAGTTCARCASRARTWSSARRRSSTRP
jgi:hypothetical protein